MYTPFSRLPVIYELLTVSELIILTRKEFFHLLHSHYISHYDTEPGTWKRKGNFLFSSKKIGKKKIFRLMTYIIRTNYKKHENHELKKQERTPSLSRRDLT